MISEDHWFQISDQNHLIISVIKISDHLKIKISDFCDTEYWSNYAENSALLHVNKLYFKVYKTGNQY